MVPIRLRLRNFMAYRHEVMLDFQGIHLAALTGENGAGKSTLLDAITWVLWGKARAKRDDDLIHLGCTEMEVEYTFDLNNSVYRLIRKRDASRKGRSDLSLHVEEAGGWRTLTETNIRATQSKINQLMRLDYDTFINSAFLLQGRADEFTTKPPGERKRILGDILGLEIYEVYEERAKERAREKKEEESGIIAKIEQIEQELAQEPEYRLELTQAEQEAAELNQRLQVAEQDMDQARQQYQAIDYKRRQLDHLRDRLRDVEADIRDLEETITVTRARIAAYSATIERRAEIETALEQLSQARQTVADWEHRLHESSTLSSRKNELDSAVQDARAKVEADLREVATKIDLYRPKVTAMAMQRAELGEAQTKLTTLQTLEKEREGWRETGNQLGQEAARLEEQNKQLKLEMNEIKAKLDQLKLAGSSCPVCRRPLDETHRAEVLAQFQSEGTAKGDLHRANRVRADEIALQQKTLQEQTTEADKQLRSLPTAQTKVATLQQSLQEAEVAAAHLTEAERQQAELQQQLDSRAFAAEVITQLAEVQAELAALGYDRVAHQQARAEVERLAHFEPDGHLLAEAERGMPDEEKRLEKELARFARLQEQTAADRQTVLDLEQETASLPELSQRLNETSTMVDKLQFEERLARDKVAGINQKLNNLVYWAKQRSEQEVKLQQVREALSIYRELQTAFGKKGVQALLIESAIPEIEDEANKLLGRMTDGRMHVRFETQREARSSDSTIETLDIRISDEIGTRDYELYSGGEAFRVNFAIRVALSKVLARRAGARLQTLVMDEGFGTQDGQGRERLVEAINAIREDFEKIIVITHIDELKDAFPVRIDVWKTAEGSQVVIR